MRKIILFIWCMAQGCMSVMAQGYTQGAKTGNPFIRNAVTDKYAVTYQALINGGLHSGTIAGRDSLLSYYQPLLRPYMEYNTPGKKWILNSGATAWVDVTGYTRTQVDSIVAIGGTVKSVSATNANGHTFTITNPTSTPNITLQSDTLSYFMGKAASILQYNYVTGRLAANYSAIQLKQPRILPSFTPFNGTVASGDSVQRALEKLQFQASANAAAIGSVPIYTGSGGVIKVGNDFRADTAVVRTVANSVNLAGLQTRLNGYVPNTRTVSGFPLSSDVTLASLTPGFGLSGTAYNGSTARTFFVDSALFRTTSNSLTLAQLQAKFNAKLNTTDTIPLLRKAGGTMTGNLYVSKTLPLIRLVDQNGNYSDWQRTAVNNTTTFTAGTSAAGNLGQSAITNSTTPVYGSMPDNGLPTTGAFTIGYWARLNTLNTTQTKVMYYGGDPTSTTGININAAPAGTFRVGYGSANTLSTISASGGILANDLNYHHIVFTYSGAGTTTGTLYIDGLSRGTSTTPLNISTVGAGFFGRGVTFGTAIGWNGDFDQAFYYGREITSSEVSTIYNNNIGTFTIPTSGLLRLYQFDQTSGTTAPESVTGTYPITFNSSPVWDLAGKVSNTAASTVTQNEFFRISDGQAYGLTSQVSAGHPSGGVNLLSSIYQHTSNGYSYFNAGLDGHIYITNNTSPTADNNKSFSPTAMFRIGSYNSSLGGQLKFDQQVSMPSASAANIGLHTWDGTRLNVITGAATVQQYAYVSDIQLDNILSKSANYTIVAGDFVSGKGPTLDLYVDATAGAVAITLPSAVTFAGYTIYVTKTDASANVITVTTVTGANTLTNQDQVRQFNSNATVWRNH